MKTAIINIGCRLPWLLRQEIKDFPLPTDWTTCPVFLNIKIPDDVLPNAIDDYVNSDECQDRIKSMTKGLLKSRSGTDLTIKLVPDFPKA